MITGEETGLYYKYRYAMHPVDTRLGLTIGHETEYFATRELFLEMLMQRSRNSAVYYYLEDFIDYTYNQKAEAVFPPEGERCIYGMHPTNVEYSKARA